MRPIPFLLAGSFVGFAFVGGVAAQGAGEPGTAATSAAQEPTVAEKVAKAIADYEAVKTDDGKKVQAARLLQWLADIDDESVTAYLGAQLAGAGPGLAAIPLLQAVARLPRPALQDAVWAILHHDQAPPVVRRHAAAAIVSMGARALEQLHRMLRRTSDAAPQAVLDAAVMAIVDSKNEEAIRGLTPLFDQGTSEEKLRYLRMLESVIGVTDISGVRTRLLKRGSLLLAAVAWRQLAIEGDPRARDLSIDLLERMPDGPTADVAAEMIIGLVLVRDEDLYPLLLRYGGLPGKDIKTALRAAAPHAAKDMALMRYMAKYGLEADQPGARDAAIMLLRQAPAEAVAPLVERVRRELRRPRPESLALATGLHELLARDPSWRQDLLKLAASDEAEVRTVGLSLLRELGSADALEYAQRSLADKHWELRAAAIRYLTTFRDVSSIPLLIARFEKEEGRLASELANALFVHTGTRCFKKNEWRDWWSKAKVGFALPHPDTVRAGLGGVAGRTSAYFGIPLVSSRIAFLVDVSGSMNAKIGTDRKRTRLDGAKEELTKAILALPDGHHVNLIAYSTDVAPLWGELRDASGDNRKELLDRAKKLSIGGGTNIYGALEAAFQDPSVDTVYLLTDGEPSVGEIVIAEDIADEVQRWNRLRQIVIHTIGFGIDSALLKRLAEDSGGVYTRVQ